MVRLHEERTGRPAFDDVRDGLQGFEFSPTMRRQLRDLDLTKIKQNPNKQVSLVHCQDSSSYKALRQHWIRLKMEVATAFIPGPRVWGARSEESNELVPAQTLATIASWIGETDA